MTTENSSKPTTLFKLKSGNHEVELRDWLTGREKRLIKNALWGGKNMTIKDGKGESDPVPMEDMDASTDKTIELMVVSIDGSRENILDTVLDMHSNDYDELMDKIEEITKPVDKSKKAGGPSSTKS